MFLCFANMPYAAILVLCGFYMRSLAERDIPKTLLIGAASSAYQVEGAWNKDGKGENIWDHMTHNRPEKIIDHSSGDVACDSYHKINYDIDIIKNLGLDFYRFSISWSRILPTGFPNVVNAAGVKYYNELIDTLIANKILPIVTIYHWELPQPLQDLGGFANDKISVWFKDYAEILFENFGGRIKTWVTINEPKQVCQFGYDIGNHAPGLNSSGVGVYLCAYNLLKAHAQVYHLYDKVYRPKQKGRIGLVIECAWAEPATNSTADVEAAERQREFDFGLYTHPIYHKNGDYPKVVKRAVQERSKLEGFPSSRLPKFTLTEIRFIRGTYDFFGLNHYSTFYVRDKQADPIGQPSQEKDTRVETFADAAWLTSSAFNYFRLVPWGIRKLLNFVKSNYNNPVILITENGFPDNVDFEDHDRIRFHKETLEEVLNAIKYDKVRIEAYTIWSLMDNFEWAFGYTLRFGLYYVNYSHPERPRIPKVSSRYIKNILKTRSL